MQDRASQIVKEKNELRYEIRSMLAQLAVTESVLIPNDGLTHEEISTTIWQLKKFGALGWKKFKILKRESGTLVQRVK